MTLPNGSGERNGGRITTAEFYKELQAQSARMDEIEQRTLSKLDRVEERLSSKLAGLPGVVNQVENNRKKICSVDDSVDDLNKRYGVWGSLNSIGAGLIAFWMFISR